MSADANAVAQCSVWAEPMGPPSIPHFFYFIWSSSFVFFYNQSIYISSKTQVLQLGLWGVSRLSATRKRTSVHDIYTQRYRDSIWGTRNLRRLMAQYMMWKPPPFLDTGFYQSNDFTINVHKITISLFQQGSSPQNQMLHPVCHISPPPSP